MITKRIYMWVLVFLPVLDMYKSGINENISLGILLTLFAFLLCIFQQRKLSIKVSRKWIFFILYGLVATVFIQKYSIQYIIHSISIMRLLKNILFWFILIFSFANKLIDFDYIIKCYKKTCFAVLLMGYIQIIVFYLMDTKFYPILISYINNEGYAKLTTSKGSLFRATSFFYEPTNYWQYCTVLLVYLLFKKDKVNNKLIKLIFVTIGIAVSLSGQALLYTILIYIFKWLYSFVMKMNYIYLINALLIILISSLLLLLFYNYDDNVKFAIDRVINGRAVTGRMGGYNYFMELPFKSKILGVGFGNIDIKYGYSSSLSTILYSTGIIGCSILASEFVFIYKKYKDDFVRAFIIVVFLLAISSDILFSTSSLFMLSFLYSYINRINYM